MTTFSQQEVEFLQNHGNEVSDVTSHLGGASGGLGRVFVKAAVLFTVRRSPKVTEPTEALVSFCVLWSELGVEAKTLWL